MCQEVVCLPRCHGAALIPSRGTGTPGQEPLAHALPLHSRASNDSGVTCLAQEGILLLLLHGCPPPPSAEPGLARGCTFWARQTQALGAEDPEARKKVPCLLSPWPGPSCPLSPGPRMSAEMPHQGPSPASTDLGPWQRPSQPGHHLYGPFTPRTPVVPHAALPPHLLVLSLRVWDDQLPCPR